MAIEVNSLFANTGYNIHFDAMSLLMKKKIPYLFLAIVGITAPVIVFLFYGLPEILLLSAIILVIPLVQDGWKFPSTVEFDVDNKVLSLTSFFGEKSLIPFADVKNIELSKTLKWATTSSFEDGNTECVYRIYLTLKNDKSQRLLRIVTRGEAQNQIDGIITHVDALLKSGV